MFLMAVLGLVWAGAAPAGAALQAVGPSIAPHGYPAYYQDFNGLRLELCVPPPAGNASRPDLCIYDPWDVDGDGNPTNDLVLTGEGFYWMASSIIPMPGGGNASIEFAVESTFGGAEEPINGQQITFGRTRIRIDTPVAGTYTITHPYGSAVFEVAVGAEEDGINMTSDIGSANFLFPDRAFAGTLNAPFGPFLTWPNYQDETSLQVRALDPVTGEPTDTVLEQYVGDPNTTSTVVGGPHGGIFRVVGPEGSGIDLQNDQWLVMGKVYDASVATTAHIWPEPPVPNLFAVGPVNRTDYFLPPPVQPPLVAVAGAAYSEDYSLGYPHWYQENIGTVEAPEGGLQLTLCPPGDAMCISDPIILTEVDPNPDNGIAEGQVALMTGGEGFWYFASATFDDGDDSYTVEFALESTFGGDESLVDGNQISFARERIRFDFDDDKPVATYRVTHPYGERILEGDPERLDRIRFGMDIGIADLADPDGAHIGTLYGGVGPTFLKWDTFVDPATLPPEELGANYPEPELVTVHDADAGLFNYFIGNPNTTHTVVGGPNGNIFRVERLVGGTVENGDWELIGETPLFAVSGKVFDPLTFEFNIDAALPIAVADAVTFNMADPQPFVIDVTANDLNIVEGGATVTVAVQPADGTAVATGDQITYTPDAGLALAGGTDTFTYQVSQTVEGTVLTSGPAEVTVTIVPIENITVDRSRFDTRRLRLDLRGTSNFPGSILTIYPGETAGGTPIGTAVVGDTGRWSFRATATANLTDVTLVSNSADATTVIQPLQVR
ncbi:Ig-like domain-containing protein [Geoalkalibacter sp.]|uniref:Ig-like domain-containing protein n=1 Tax=Geoalkalibacter sp. TaxID=3041440 RepID=UPI00272EB563|nr:Ig-like domain-containing protein [Geoalkalibacter sp.]